MVIFEREVKVLPADNKTNISFPFAVPDGIREIKIEYSYSPKELGDGERAKRLIEECLLHDTGKTESIIRHMKSFSR